MKYMLNLKNANAVIHIDKNCKLKLRKNKDNVYVLKEQTASKSEKSEESRFRNIYESDQYINSSDIYFLIKNIRHIGFEVTDMCNLKCTYCVYGELYNNYDLRINKKIEWNKAKIFMDCVINSLSCPMNASKEHEVYVSFYGGEPLLNMDFIEKMVAYTQSFTHVHFVYMMTTNAVYLRKYIGFLSQYNFRVMISLDGAKENDLYRQFPNGEDSFDLVYSNIKYAQEKYPDYFNKNISFNSVMHDLTNPQETYSFIYNEFGKVPKISMINRNGIKEEQKLFFEKISSEKRMSKESEEEFEKIDQTLDLNAGKYVKLRQLLFSYSGNVFEDYNNLLEKEENIRYIPTATCLPFSKRIFMTVNNKILPCEKIGQQFYLGRVTDNGVEIDCEEVASKYNTYYKSLKTQCEKCYHKMNCQKCMYDIPGFDKNPKCDDFVDEEAFSKELDKYMNILRENPHLYRRFMTEILTVR